MKTKIILLSIIAVLGLVVVFAFKQNESSKKYLTITVNLNKELIIVDENGKAVEKKLSKTIFEVNGAIDITNELNSISAKGYKLVSTTSLAPGITSHIQYIFEKE